MKRLYSRGFGGVDLIMVVLTLVVVIGVFVFVFTQSDGEESQLDADMVTTEVEQPDQSAAGSSDELAAANARDAERRENLKVVQADLEAYFESNSNYPTTAEFGNAAWRSSNLYRNGDSEAAYTSYPIMYSVRPSSCDNDTFICASYDVAADLEFDGLGSEDSDGDTSDAVELSEN